jgi:hypothetical protein
MNKHVGIGFRRDLADIIIDKKHFQPAFIELAPENWIEMGGYWKKKLDAAAEVYPVTCHGLSLSVGSPDDLDYSFLKKLNHFLKQYDVKVFSEHLSYTKSQNAHLYDLLPIPFKEDAIKHVSNRIREVQEILERKIAIENVSYYTPVAAEMTEAEFITSIVEEADCQLLLDVNNVYVNAFNHQYDAKEFINQLPLDRVAYIHMAGHEQVEPDLIIDTHGQPIIEKVYELFEWTIDRMKPVPVLLERDYNFNDIPQLSQELSALEHLTLKKWEVYHETV